MANNPAKPTDKTSTGMGGGQNTADANRNVKLGQSGVPGQQAGGPGTYQPGTYPRWDAAWEQHLPDIDKQIASNYSGDNPGSPQSANKVNQGVKDWFDKQQLDSETRNQFQQACAGPAFNNRVQDRVRELQDSGKLGKGGQSGQTAKR